MKSPFKSHIYFFILSALLVSSYSYCEQLSAVFVLETSDSNDSSPAALVSEGSLESSSSPLNKTQLPENTRIITDEIQPTNSNAAAATGTISGHNRDEKPQNDDYKPAEGQVIAKHNSDQQTTETENYNKQQQQQQQSGQIRSTSGPTSGSQATHEVQIQETRSRELSSSARKIEDDAKIQPQTRLKVGTNPTRSTNIQQQQQQQPQAATNQQRTRSTSTTTTSSYDRDTQTYGNQQQQQGTTPKTEERLLISIVSEDDDYRPPQKQIGSSGGISNDELLRPPQQQQQQQQQQNQKRKPSITISIQDANINKQNGGSGQSVIVRPSENGQSIVISTIGGATLGMDHLTSTSSSLNNNNYQNNKFNTNQNKPTITSPINEPAYGREPIEIPIQNGNHHQIIHHPSTTTYRPSLANNNNNNNNNDYIPPSIISNPNRLPITLLEQSRPPIGGADERPQRPVAVINNDNYDGSSGGSQRPTSRPVNRPTGQDLSGAGSSISNNNNNDNDEVNRPTNTNDNPQQQESKESKYSLNERNCGLVHETKIVGGDEVDPDDFLWMAAIVKSKLTNGEARPFCGGSLITRRHILTAAHCLENLAPRDVLVRLGGYDFDDSTASSLSMDFAIDQFRVPAQYSKKTHVADIAIMRLKTPLSTNDNYKTVCMPQPRRSYVGALGTVTGYGSQSQTFRRATPKLRQVTVPIWENRKCSIVYKKNLTESFLCAGYEEGGKDACQGDSGGPIMTEGPNERMMVVGVVSHGIGCGAPGYPGVYTRTTTFLDWIEKNTRE